MTDQADLIYERLLVVRAQAGDEAAVGELVERYSPRLRYFLRKLLITADAAEDALQDVWLDVLRHLPKLADPQALRAWLYRIARDRAFRRLRKAGRQHEPLDERELANGQPEPVFTAEDAAQIHAALDRLPAHQREVLVLRFLEDMPYDDIARIIGCPLGTLRSRLHYAKRALRETLARPCQ